MISSKDLYLETYYGEGSAAEWAMREEYEAREAWYEIMAWAEDQTLSTGQFYWDLREPGLQPVDIDPADLPDNPEWNWFMCGDSMTEEGREIPFRPVAPAWRIPA